MSAPTPPPLPDGTAPAAPPPVPDASGAPPVPPAAAPASPALAELDTSCPSCGATVAYAPGTTSLKCPSCGGLVPITGPVGEVHEHSYDDWAAAPHKAVASIGKQTLTCQGCGATTDTDELATRCQFCHGALVAVNLDKDLIAPEAVVPFHVDKKGSGDAFRKWVGSRRFAPNALKQIGSTEALAGTYVPHWTYDSHSETDYTGERGDYYYVEVPHQVSDGKGGTRTEMQQERRTRWSNAHGHVSRSFDDILVPGSDTLPAKKLNKMGPWELDKAVSYRPEYLVGYSALRYDVDPDKGMEAARGVMKAQIDSDVRSDIGGDEQKVSREDISYSANMFKLVLMPLWIASYIYGGKTFQVMVNANTGEVVGDRPYSKAKIAIAILVTLLILAIIIGVIVVAH